SVQVRQGRDNPQSRPDSTLCIIFMGLRIPKVDEQAVADIPREISVKVPDLLGAGLLIGEDYLAQFFRVKFFGERGRTHQVTEHPCKLAAFGFWRVPCRQWRLAWRRE